MSSAPAFLLIMPSYNQAHYIAAAVDSVLSQDDPDWVLWVIDNSSDNTPEVMRRYSDPRIHFVHIPQRMDPGSCLNWVLEREGPKHRDFSYIHTDNFLRADYVRQMRQALSSSENTLAYCDMRNMDDQGALTGVPRRGKFDLARLFSLSPLGVPFSATTGLARELGGFSCMDVADDVVFCLRSWPHARFVHIPDAIMDYRLHGDSRTEAHGGALEMCRSFLGTYLRLLPEMRAKGCDPIQALWAQVLRLQSDVQMRLEDVWYREREFTAHMPQQPSLQTWFDLQLIDLPKLRVTHTNPFIDRAETDWMRLKGKIKKRLRRWRGQLPLNKNFPLAELRAHIPRRSAWDLCTQLRDHAVPWLYLSVQDGNCDVKHLRLASTDIHTLWISLMLHRIYGWRFKINPTSGLDLAEWPHLDVAPHHTAEADTLISLAPGNVWVKPVAGAPDTPRPVSSISQQRSPC